MSLTCDRTGVLMHDIEERAELVDFVQLAGQGAGEVEAKSVDVHIEHPVPQAVHDELQHARIEHVERIAATGEIGVIPLVLARKPVIRGVVDPAERQRGAQVVSLGGVVVNDVENHLKTCGVQIANHRLEFAQRVAVSVARL